MAQSHGGGPAPSIPDNEVWYYAPAQVSLYSSTDVVSHTFADGKGVLTFANPVTIMKAWLQGKNTITDVTMPETVTDIGEYTFQGCTSLALTTLPSGLTSIGSRIFRNCTNLALTSLPSGVTSIGAQTFQNCNSIQSLIIDRAEPPALGTRAFDNTSFPIYVPASAVDTYKAASNWSTYASRIFAIPE